MRLGMLCHSITSAVQGSAMPFRNEGLQGQGVTFGSWK